MNLFQIGLLFSLPVHTYLPGKQVIGRILFMCIGQGVQSATCTFQHLCLRTVWYGAAKINIPERWQAVGMHSVVLATEEWQITSGLTIPSLYD
jgi:hypothetical protein